MGKTLLKIYNDEIKKCSMYKNIKKFKNTQNKLKKLFILIKDYNKLLQFFKYLNIGTETDITKYKIKEFIENIIHL
jgi:hypothetical protein